MKALFLLAFGGPRSLDEVELLLTRLFKGRKPSSEQLERVKERYRLIGGCSPLSEITSGQAEALEKELNSRGHAFKSYVGMRYGYPLIEETLKQIIRDGFKEIVALPMTPFQSRASTGAYIEEVNQANEKLGGVISISFLKQWHCHPLYIEALREKIEEGLKEFEPASRKGVHLLFTAHSLPKSAVENDPYVKEIEESVCAVLQRVGPRPWHIAYQSKGGGPEEWIGPDVEKVLEDLGSQEVKEVLLVPVGFLTDHIEILYDVDIVFQKKADFLGMVLKRTRSLNTSERFIKALASAVEEQLGGFEDSRVQGTE
jgi:ferrochelatase